jgi:hypothetical protein
MKGELRPEMNTKIDHRQKYCFCTLALGVNYCNLAKQLACDLAQFSPESTLLVLTDHPSIFNNVNNVDVVYHRKRSVNGYNDKLCVIYKALESANTCIFLDADFKILGPIHLDQSVFEPGLRAFRVYSWQYMRDVLMAGEPSWWKGQAERMMVILREKWNPQYADGDIYCLREELFSVTRNDKVDLFLKKWNDLAEFCEKNRCFRLTGISIGLAALLTGYPLYQHEFPGIRYFEPTKSLEEVAKGLMTQKEYDSLNAAVENLKAPGEKRSSSFPGIWRSRLIKGLRYARIKLFGLNLLKLNDCILNGRSRYEDTQKR